MANEQGKKAVPGIPLNALDAITDPNVRDVLRALVAAHHVRNGNSGTGDERFITAKDMAATNKLVATTTINTATTNLAVYVDGVGDGTYYSSGSFSAVGTLTMTLANAGNVALHVVWQSINNGGSNCNTRMALYSDGTSILDTSHSCQNGFTEPHCATCKVALDVGMHTFTIKFGNDFNTGFNIHHYQLGRWSITAIPVT